MKETNRLISILICFFLTSVNAQSTIESLGAAAVYVGNGESEKRDGRFSVKIIGVESTDADMANSSLLKSIDLNVQWWTLLGEPMEYYDVRWNAKDWYRIENYTVHRNQLMKYPDLLRRFDNLRPTKLAIRLTGKFNFKDHTEVTKNPIPHLEPFYNKNSSWISSGRNFLDDDGFTYIIKDDLLIISKNGKVGKGIIPNSPEKWEDFLQYEAFMIIIPNTTNDYKNGFKKLSASEKEIRRKQLKTIFQKAQGVELTASVHEIEWPESEMLAIAELYEKYEKGEKEPSPMEELEQRMKTEVAGVGESKRDGFWSEPEWLEEPKLVIFSGENGKEGVRDENSGRVIVAPGKYRHIEKIISEKHIVVYDDYSKTSVCSGYEHPSDMLSISRKLLNSQGEEVIRGSFHEISQAQDGYDVITYDCTYEYSKSVVPSGGGLVRRYLISGGNGVKTKYDRNFKVISKEKYSY